MNGPERWSTPRRWAPTDGLTVDGVTFRTVPGSKAPSDLRLEWYISGRWIPVAMSAGLVMADFFYENEERLFPYPADGGERYLRAIRDAARTEGWDRVATRLAADRERRRRQQERWVG
jgi:hypothetical protein